MSELIVTKVLPLILGPAGTLVVLSIILMALFIGAWRAFKLWGAPAFSKWFEAREAHIRELMNEHKQDRKVWADGMSSLSDKLGVIDRKVDRLTEEVEELKDAWEK